MIYHIIRCVELVLVCDLLVRRDSITVVAHDTVKSALDEVASATAAVATAATAPTTTIPPAGLILFDKLCFAGRRWFAVEHLGAHRLPR